MKYKLGLFIIIIVKVCTCLCKSSYIFHVATHLTFFIRSKLMNTSNTN